MPKLTKHDFPVGWISALLVLKNMMIYLARNPPNPVFIDQLIKMMNKFGQGIWWITRCARTCTLLSSRFSNHSRSRLYHSANPPYGGVTTKQKLPTSQLRIIGGKWRGRKIQFVATEGLRPTADRVRETLFNWLMPIIHGKTCLDLFAGSGVLGFEALSRGATKVTLVDNQNINCKQLHATCEKLQCMNDVTIRCESAEQFLQNNQQQFDIIFLDPPFHQGLIAATCSLIDTTNALAKNGYVYLETEKTNLESLSLPTNWKIIKQQTAGMVGVMLMING